MAELGEIGRILQLTGGVFSPEVRERNARFAQINQQQEQLQQRARIEAKQDAREFIARQLGSVPADNPNRGKLEQAWKKLNQELGEDLPMPVSSTKATDVTPARADRINESLDSLVQRLPQDAQPFLASQNFADPVKRRQEIFKVSAALQKPQNRDRQIRQLVTADGSASTILDDKQGNFYDLSGQKIELPEGARVVNAAQLQGGADELGLPKSEAIGLRDAEVGTRQMIATVGDAITMLDETPDINTFTARTAGFVNDLQQEGKAIASALGKEFDENLLDPSNYSGDFDALGIENARMRSLVTALAFSAAAASGQTGRAVSDTDIKRFIRETGASSSDPRAFATTLRDLANRTARNFKINYETRTGKPFQGNLTGALPSANDLPVVKSQADYDALQSGQRFIENGEEYRKP